MKQQDYMSIVNTLRERLESLYDIETLTQVSPSLHPLNPAGQLQQQTMHKIIKALHTRGLYYKTLRIPFLRERRKFKEWCVIIFSEY